MFKFPDWCYRCLPSTHKFWITLWLIWFTVLWYLSSITIEIKDTPDIPHLDKVAHFCNFMVGGFCFANFLYLKKSPNWGWQRIILITILVGAVAGGIDEFHQTMTPGRTGNDLGDWCADFFGTIAGTYYCFFMWQRLKKNHSLNV